MDFKEIIYMGAANSVAEFQYSVLPYLQHHRGTRFWSFMLSDKNERNERYPLDILMRGSLLVWIDSLFEPQLNANQLRFGREASQGYIAIEDADVWPRICRIAMGGDQEKPEPKTHSDFNEPAEFGRIMA